jgi:hypothetical protein
MHIVIIFIIIVAIISIQGYFYIKTEKECLILQSIFPDVNSLQFNQNEILFEENSTEINNIFLEILFSINVYLKNYKSVVIDYYIIKDIIERNIEIKEEEINSQLPIPLYLGLVGTMSAIIFGLGSLLFSGGLNHILDYYNLEDLSGIENLLWGVALAMTTSLFGIFFTIRSSLNFKKAKVLLSNNKNNFILWIQSNIFPNFSNDIYTALIKVSDNLLNFNEKFSENTFHLKNIIDKVIETHKIQSELINKVSELNIKKISTANIEVYNHLKNCTNEIGILTKHISLANQYISNIQLLTNKLDEYERRTQIIEKAGEFYIKYEKWLSEIIDKINIEIQSALERLNDSLKKSLIMIQENLSKNLIVLEEFMNKYQKILFDNLNTNTENIGKNLIDFHNLVNEQQKKLLDHLDNNTENIGKSLIVFEKIINEQQNKLIDYLNKSTENIELLFLKQREIINKSINFNNFSDQLNSNDFNVFSKEIKKINDKNEILHQEFLEIQKNINNTLDKIIELIDEIRKLKFESSNKKNGINTLRLF